ncbi:MAG: hypothetical protein HXY34_02680 [Candidatus Thorarchaeota archaeon]|nr:hypothetical protein [Candidatus Thorarchaeota archaeon]
MTGLLLSIVVFIASYVAICILADAVINSLIESSRTFSVSPVVLGLLVLGVDIEESMVSLVAVVAGLPYLSLGNLIGNTVIALGIAIGLPALFMTVRTEPMPSFYPMVFSVCGALVVISMVFPSVLWLLGMTCLAVFLVYLIQTRRLQSMYKEAIVTTASNDVPSLTARPRLRARSIIRLLVGLVLLLVSADILVTSAGWIIVETGLSESYLGLVVTAFATNAEEMWLTVSSVRRGHTELGMSAQVGKILWNLALVYGVCSVIAGSVAFNAMMTTAALVLAIAMAVTTMVLSRGVVSKKTGFVLVLLMLVFVSVSSLLAVASP